LHWLKTDLTRTEQHLVDVMTGMDIIDCHEHLPPEKVRLQAHQDLFTLFSHYTRLPLFASGMTEAEKESLHDPEIPLEKRWRLFHPHLHNIRFTSYVRAAFIAAREIYGFDDINDETYRPLSEAIGAMNTPGIYKRIFDHCRIRAVLTQCRRTDVEFPLVPLMLAPVAFSNREDMQKLFGVSVDNIRSLDDYLAAIHSCVKQWAAEGIVGLKTHSRPTAEPDARAAEAALKRLLDGEKLATRPNETEPLRDYALHHVLDMAAEMELVVAVHSGVWGDFRNLDPRHMLNIAPAHPDTRFDLYHLGMPDVRAAIMIGKMCPNVWLNLCWCHVISQEQTCSAMNEMLDMVPLNKVLAFGGDYRMPVEKIVGHLRMARENIARVLGARIDRGRMDMDDAREILRLWFWQNPRDLYTRLDIESHKRDTHEG